VVLFKKKKPLTHFEQWSPINQQCDVNFLNIAEIAPKCLMQTTNFAFERPINLSIGGTMLGGEAY
jgi:hypothetical protein